MYTVIRYYYPHGIEGELMKCTFKDYETKEKALAYALRYSRGVRFAGMQIENEDFEIVFEITSDQEIIDKDNFISFSATTCTE